MTYSDALAYLDAHASYEKTGRIESPTTERMRTLVEAMGDPQFTYPVIHITGTNGKGSTSQMITRLLMAHGLTVGTYPSPHLERPNERMSRNGEPLTDEEFAEQIAAVADLAVVVGVIEVGVLGKWDATNVCNAQVAVITNIGMDHNEFAGPTKGHVAAEKAGVIKPGSLVVVGETDPELLHYFTEAGGESVLVRGEHFDVMENQLALGGRMLDLRTPTTIYTDV